MSYLLLKLIHIISATIMIGTGLGSAFYLFFSYWRKNKETFKNVLKLVILADNIFTAPSVLIQIITGVIITSKLGWLKTDWFLVVAITALIVFLLWLRAVYLQIKMHKIVKQTTDKVIPGKVHRMMKEWILLGIPAFIGSGYLFYLMVYKPFM